MLISFLSASPALSQAKWSYDGDTNGQEEWGILSTKYAACEIGSMQSPIQIGETKITALPLLDIPKQPVTANFRYDSHGLHIAVSHSSGLLTVDKEKYSLKGIEIRSPSEHTVGDTFYMLEIQFMYTSAAGKNLIVASFANVGDKNKGIESILSAIEGVDFSLPITTLLPEKRGYYAYTGSITTPPCTESVEWRIFKQPITLSHEQLEGIVKFTKRNARLQQPVYMRVIKESKEP